MPSRSIAPACIVTPEFPGPMLCGGLGTAVYWQARALRAAGVPVVVFCTGDVTIGTPAEWRERFRREIDVDYIDAATWMGAHAPELLGRKVFPNHYNLIRALWAQTFLERQKFPVVYLQDYGGHGLRALQAKAAGLAFAHTRFVLTLHGPTEWALEGLEIFATAPEQLVIEHQERECARLADEILAPSAYLRDWIAERWGVPARRIRVLPYCFEAPAPGESQAVHGPFSHLVFFGRLETRKGLEIFLEALQGSAAVRQHVRRVTFLGKSGQAAGTTGRLCIEQALAKEAGFAWEILDDRDTFQAWNWLAAQRDALVVAPSLVDNLPFAVIELFQRRLAFVTTTAGGIPEIVGDNLAVLAEPTAAGLRSRLETILRDGSLMIRHDTGFDPEAARAATVKVHRAAARRAHRAVEPAAPTGVREDGPEVSVIVPHFNCAGYLRMAVDSLAAQECPFRYEVIVVDDASTRPADREGFARLARDYAHDPRFRFFPETTNRGAAGARNFGARHAQGRFLAFFDADNEAYPFLLATYRRALEVSGCDVLTCFLESVTQDDYESPRPLDRSRVDLFFTPPGPALEAGCFMNVFGDTGSMCRREAFDRVGGFSADAPLYRRIPSGDWDWDFFSKSALAGLRVSVVPRALFRYRNSSGNQQNTNRRRYYRNRSIILSRYATPEARRRVDWFRLLALFEGGGRVESAPVTGLYEYFTRLPDDLLKAVVGRAPGTPNDLTIRRIRARMRPLLAEWERRRPRVWIYGAGLHTRVLLGVVPELAEHVVGLVDRAAGGGEFLGWPVVKPDLFEAGAADVVVYSSKEHERAMHQAFAHHPVEHVLIYA